MTVRLPHALLLSLAVLAHAGAAAAEPATYSGDIRDIVATHCLGCHSSDSPEYPAFKQEKERWIDQEKGPRMDTYAHLTSFTAWPDTGALMRRLDDGKASKDGKPGNMYEHLGANEAERQKNLGIFRSWVGNWVLKRWPEISKEELGGISVKY